MHRRWMGAALVFGLAVAATGTATAQLRQQLQSAPPSLTDQDDDSLPATLPQPGKPSRARAQADAPAFEHDPDLDANDQLAPSQIRQPMPAAVATPTGGEMRVRAAAHSANAAAEPEATAKPSHAAKQYVIACSGVFGRDSSHSKLAMAFQSHNVAFTQVDAPSGKAMASVLFAKDPKRRLEVWWSNPASRTNTHLIVINGKSDWIAPGELHLGLTLAELEKLNGKPFKLSGFDNTGVATLTEWNGGRLSALAGGCKVGLSLHAAPTTPASALAGLPADREFSSADGTMRAANATVSEILVAY
ncbi:MAG TPA: hypothetical protein VEJ37_08175 [Xanthobacteraceae bacterium]|nr:hypothetical protein [Xanthobacteraceae bacterium]